ncbi:armadillo repeat-containing protein 3 isoform X2 [Melanotaenia boesemani]|uniref:armadillo repeat-containing protein 3 isoform X2 n=1 Tax=Melanotaenia boesemani TaxID=1250792 RepID=UPI001C03EAD2|nr:armadillo repeat-containing protein 3 isoform X2 [Melanotaenia boesemani]
MKMKTSTEIADMMEKKSRKASANPRKETFEPLPVESKTPTTAVLLLSSPEEDILLKACEAIYAFAEKGDENKVSLLRLGALHPLCRLITHSNRLVRRNALMALGIMATNGHIKSALKKLNVIPSIVEKLFAEEETVVHEFATLCLAALSVDFVCKVQIFENNGLPLLIHLLSSSDPDVQKNSVEIIFNLVQDYQSRQAVHKLGGIPPLLELLKSDFPIIQRLALKVLQNITTDGDTCNSFREYQGYEKLMDILNNMNLSDLHAEALQVVANCLSESETIQLIHNGGGLTRLMEFILIPNLPQIQSTAVKCFARMAQSCESRKLLHEQGVEKVLVQLLSVSDVSVMVSTCQAVAAMSFYPASKESFRDLGTIPAVVQFLSSESLVLREAATQALTSLTHDNQLNALAVYEAGGHEILIQQLYGSCLKTVAYSAATLCNIAEQEITRSSILSYGAIEALVELLTCKDTEVLVNTILCVAALVCDKEARTKLQRAGGLQPLVSLLRSNHKDVLHNACFAVNVCASDKPTAVEMCKFGALEILQEISQSVNRRNSFSELAMASLLNSNLSVKYSLTGHLSSTDIITDGFYDAGKACSSQRVLTLEELSKKPVDQHRAIIVINIATEESVDVPQDRQSNRSESDVSSKKDQRTARRKKEEDKQKNQAHCESPSLRAQNMTGDVSLQLLVKEAKESILPLNDERKQYAALARLVSGAMGGEVPVEKLHEFSWVLHLSELKFQLQSNVVPIGLISKGIYCHRALLFKCLADCIGMSCTLVRGEYNRAWNEVFLFSENPSNNHSSSPPSLYIVDLMHQPGNLLALNSPAALKYQTI